VQQAERAQGWKSVDSRRQALQSDFVATAIRAQLRHKLSTLAWRTDSEYHCRLAIAWAFNGAVMVVACLFAIIYALKLKDAATRRMAVTWLISYGVTFAIIEPFQVLMMTCAPWLFEDTTRFGRFCLRCRSVYNELCAP